MMCKLKGGCKSGHYDVQIKEGRWIRESIIMLQIVRWMQKEAL